MIASSLFRNIAGSLLPTGTSTVDGFHQARSSTLLQSSHDRDQEQWLTSLHAAQTEVIGAVGGTVVAAPAETLRRHERHSVVGGA